MYQIELILVVSFNYGGNSHTQVFGFKAYGLVHTGEVVGHAH